MGDIFLAIILAGILGTVGMALFPTFNVLFRNIDTTGMFPILAAGIRFMPYVIIFIIIYGIINIIKNRVNH